LESLTQVCYDAVQLVAGLAVGTAGNNSKQSTRTAQEQSSCELALSFPQCNTVSQLIIFIAIEFFI
jgi:hypothetical protein